MCNPLAAVFGVSTALGIGGKISKRAAEKKLSRENRRAALANHQTRSNTIFARQAEIEAATSERSFSAAVEAAKAQGRIAASASARGATGSTVARLEQGVDAEIGRSQRLAELNDEFKKNQTERNLGSSLSQFQNEFANAKAPSALSFGLGIASSALGGAIGFNDATDGSLFG